jgi:hypothetical protein
MNNSNVGMPTLSDAQIVRAMKEGIDVTNKSAVYDFLGRNHSRNPTRDTLIEPAPPSHTPDMGLLWEGGGNPRRAVGADVETIFKAFSEACGQLHPTDVQKIRGLMRKYSGTNIGPTNRMGVTSTDHIRDPDARTLRQMRDANISAVEAMNQANADLWDGGPKRAA